MIPEIIKSWDSNKNLLEDYFRKTPQSEYDSYKSILIKIFELVINKDNVKYDVNKITEIDDGEYQGTQLFIIPLERYQPSVEDYFITDNEYGSCSGCDTLLSISSYEQELPSEEQVKEYMILSLHLIQKFKRLT